MSQSQTYTYTQSRTLFNVGEGAPSATEFAISKALVPNTAGNLALRLADEGNLLFVKRDETDRVPARANVVIDMTVKPPKITLVEANVTCIPATKNSTGETVALPYWQGSRQAATGTYTGTPGEQIELN
jgi:hypothetical protein